jgi:hypothetical protein
VATPTHPTRQASGQTLARVWGDGNPPFRGPPEAIPP